MLSTLLNTDRASGDGLKYAGPIAVPSSFDAHELSFAYAQGEVMYDLVGVVQHQGETFHGGHYIAMIAGQGRWRCFNDSIVLDATVAAAAQSAAARYAYTPFMPHVVMYERRRRV